MRQPRARGAVPSCSAADVVLVAGVCQVDHRLGGDEVERVDDFDLQGGYEGEQSSVPLWRTRRPS